MTQLAASARASASGKEGITIGVDPILVNGAPVVPVPPPVDARRAQVVSIDDEIETVENQENGVANESTPLVALSSRGSVTTPGRDFNDNDGHYGVYEHIYNQQQQQQNNRNALMYHDASGANYDDNNNQPVSDNESGSDGPSYQDKHFAIIFIIHLGIMAYLACAVAPLGFKYFGDNFAEWKAKGMPVPSIDDDQSQENWEEFQAFVVSVIDFMDTYAFRILIYLVIPCVELAFAFTALFSAYIVRPYAMWWVTASIVMPLVLFLVMLVLSFLSAPSFFSLVVVTLFGVGACYIAGRILWPMRAFTAANLHMSITGLTSNCGMYIMALIFAEISFLWISFWGYVSFGVLNHLGAMCEREHPDAAAAQLGQGDSNLETFYHNSECNSQGWAVALLLLSLYWTSSVLMNTVQVTVAGVMATWCFDKDSASGCCSSAVSSSLYRSVSYSFGSICFGSLLQGLVQLLRVLVDALKQQRRDESFRRGGRNQDDCGMLLLCLLECLVKLLEDVLDYFNRWAWVFVGVYGYSYLESGRRVLELFRRRGVTSIVVDNLVGYVLGYTSLVVGVATGAIAVTLDMAMSQIYSTDDSYLFGSLPSSGTFAFFIGLIVGVYISAVMASVIRGAVNTLIVCWADAPDKLVEDHPELTAELSAAWSALMKISTENAPVEPMTI